jgi:hypothetical protein
MVGPGACFEGLGGRDTNGGVLATEGGDSVVEVVGVANEGDIGSLEDVRLVRGSVLHLRLTQRSSLPAMLILDPLGTTAPLYVQGPVTDGAL